ncbi:VWFA-related domain-containing protein [Granulicella rosea]|uniref:VWFA-related domain-containing protein n=1 Tax=Granulicella rosea TaxID=474952 RepID=A0A239IDR4_9BACT|nr:VWA domain-containing protein [Granulicella rosea]SNS91669.1 VWFA-related domain-containing protein [Granulicella rosea]
MFASKLRFLPLLLVCVSTFLTAQQPAPAPAPDKIPTLKITSREVVLDVLVLDKKGHSIQGLKAGDFQVVEDGAPQVVRAVSEHRALTPEEVARLAPDPLAPNEFTNYAPAGNTNSVSVILIDALDSPTTAQMYLRQQLIAFMKSMPPGNTFAIFQMDRRMHLVQGFTSDPQVLLKAVEGKRDEISLPANLNSATREAMMHVGLKMMGQYLAGFSGRKNLIWFTGSVPHEVFSLTGNPFPDSVDFDNMRARFANALSLSRVAVYPVDDRGLEVFREHEYSHAVLDEIAERTGGRSFHDTNGLKEALAQITETGSNYYTLAFSPTNPVWLAHKRHLTITVAGREHATLLYRHVYFARSGRKAYWKKHAQDNIAELKPPPPPADIVQTAGDGLDAALELGSMISGELPFRLSAMPAPRPLKLAKDAPWPKDNYLEPSLRTKPFREFELLYTVDPHNVGFTQTEDGVSHAQLEFLVAVYDAQGAMVNSLKTTRVSEIGDANYRRMLESGTKLTLRQTIAVPEKGNYFLRLVVHNPDADQTGSLEIPVDNIQRGVAGPGQQLISSSQLP